MRIILLTFLLMPLTLLSQVNLQTGAAQFNVPLFNYSDKDGLNFSGNLDYVNGNGLRVNDIASCVGTGFRLRVGGSIESIQNGEPDDQVGSPENSSVSPKVPHGYLYATYNVLDNIDNRAGYIPLYPNNYRDNGTGFPKLSKYTDDREADYFRFNFNGRSGTFIIGKNNVVQILGDSKLKVSFTFFSPQPANIRTSINSFIITDEAGIQYLFQDQILNEVTRYFNGLPVGPRNLVNKDGGINPSFQTSTTTNYKVFQAYRLNEYVVQGWYLSQIINPRTLNRIVLNYETYDIDQRSPSNPEFDIHLDQYPTLLISRSIVKAKRLIDITSPAFTTNIHFTYASNSRADLLNDKPLVRIDYNLNGKTTNSYSFSYGYLFKSQIVSFDYNFIGDERIMSRLCLLSLQRNGYDGKKEPPYQFNYNINNPNVQYSIPPMYSVLQDKWGYYNDYHHPMDAFPFDPNQDTFHVTSSSTIDYITRQASTTRIVSPGFAKFGILQSVQKPEGGVLSFDYEQRDVSLNNQNVLIGGVRVNKTTLFDGIDHANDIVNLYNYYDANSNSTGWGYDEPVFEKDKTLRYYKTTNHSAFMSIKDISFNVKSLIDSRFNVGSFKALVGQIGIAALFYVVSELIYYFSPDYQDYPTKQYSFVPFNSNYIEPQYSSVEVKTLTKNGTNGKNVYEFTSPSNINIPLLVPVSNPPYSNKQRMTPWLYGMPKMVSTYKGISSTTYQLVKQIEYQYNFNTPGNINNYMYTYNDPNFASQKWEVIQPEFHDYTVYNSFMNIGPGTSYDNILSDTYYPYTGRSLLMLTKERIYNANGVPIETIKQYGYSSNNFELNYSKIINSKGEILENYIYFPQDYANTGVFADLVSNNILNVAISNETWLTKPGASPVIISASATEFSRIANNDIRPINSYALEVSGPVSDFQPFNPNSAVRDSRIVLQKQFIYDNNGNLSGSISHGVKSSVINDYNSTLVTMNVMNAGASEFAYTSFEGDNLGGWNYDPLSVNIGAAVTGKKFLTLSATANINTTVSISKPYILSLWANNAGFFVNGSNSPSKTIIGSQGWTYYEFQLTSGTASPTITGTANIDEIRLYPSDARMVTSSYDEYGNKTSVCDFNSIITYYEYNGLGKVILERDKDRFILKKYCYTFSGNTEDCNIYYGNTFLSKDFTTLCDSYSHSDPYSFIVYPGTFTSSISVEDANSKALVYANQYGQSAANNYGHCTANQIYARLSYENVNGNIADIVIRFFEDSNCTIPYFVTNLPVNIQETSYNDVSGITSTVFNVNAMSNGSVFNAWYGLLYESEPDGSTNTYNYNLLPGTGYTVVP